MTKEKRKEIDLLATAIVKLFAWQSRQLELKEERRIKAMLTRQRNLLRLLWNNSKLSLPD